MKTAISTVCAVILAAGLTTSSTHAAAVDPAMGGLIGNSLIQSGDSWERHTWYNADGVYYTSGYWTEKGVTGMGGDDGKYSVTGGQLCQRSNLNGKSVCTLPGLNHKLGDKWDGKTADGKPEHYEILVGHQ